MYAHTHISFRALKGLQELARGQGQYPRNGDQMEKTWNVKWRLWICGG